MINFESDSSDYQPTSSVEDIEGAHERRREYNEQTRAALQRASDELVDEATQTPWERQREQVVDVDDDEDASEPETYLDQLRQRQPASHLASFTHDKDRMR